MKEKLSLSREELFEVTEIGSLIKTGSWKYGRLDTYVFERDGNNYKVSIAFHYNEGLMESESSHAVKVKPIATTTVEWVEE